MKQKIKSWKDCRDSKNIESAVISAGGSVRNCNGSHRVAEIPGKGSMTFYESENISTGVACKIFKWLKTMGVLATLILGILSWLQ
jgi:hypothetical protein